MNLASLWFILILIATGNGTIKLGFTCLFDWAKGCSELTLFLGISVEGAPG